MEKLEGIVQEYLEKARTEFFPRHPKDHACFILDSDRQIIHLEGNALRNLGYDPNTFLGKTFTSDLIYLEDLSIFLRSLGFQKDEDIDGFYMGLGIQTSNQLAKHYRLSLKFLRSQEEARYVVVIGEEEEQWSQFGASKRKIQFNNPSFNDLEKAIREGGKTASKNAPSSLIVPRTLVLTPEEKVGLEYAFKFYLRNKYTEMQEVNSTHPEIYTLIRQAAVGILEPNDLKRLGLFSVTTKKPNH